MGVTKYRTVSREEYGVTVWYLQYKSIRTFYKRKWFFFGKKELVTKETWLYVPSNNQPWVEPNRRSAMRHYRERHLIGITKLYPDIELYLNEIYEQHLEYNVSKARELAELKIRYLNVWQWEK